MSGLEGVVAAETKLSMVDGERGELIIAGFPVAELALNATFEETVALLIGGHRRLQTLPLASETLDLLAAAAKRAVDPMDALGMAASCSGRLQPVEAPAKAGAYTQDDEDAYNLLGSFPTIVAAYWRLLHDRAPIAPRADLGHAANYLFMLTGEVPPAARVRGLETYLNTVVDHGLNASTFTARVIASTGSDFVSAIAGAVGALKGPLHGGAPGPALDMVFEIGDLSRAEAVLRRKIESGERLMGFGHRVYKVRDPRADVLAAAAERMLGPGDALYDLARGVEAVALRLLEEYKPGRKLQTNVEFYTALLLHGLGLETPLFTPTFAISRVAGWIAHCFEQRAANRLIRPQSVYVGQHGRRWPSPGPFATLRGHPLPASGARGTRGRECLLPRGEGAAKRRMRVAQPTVRFLVSFDDMFALMTLFALLAGCAVLVAVAAIGVVLMKVILIPFKLMLLPLKLLLLPFVLIAVVVKVVLAVAFGAVLLAVVIPFLAVAVVVIAPFLVLAVIR